MRRPPVSMPDLRAESRLDVDELPDEVFEQVDQLATEFLERRRRGERPTMDDYANRHPELAAAIRMLFPALVMVEQLRPDSDETIGHPTGSQPPIDEPPPALMGDYRILREIGRGGMGVVYEAEQESLGRRVALKVLGSWAGMTEPQIRRFHREARSAAQLHHTNIVPVFGVGEHQGRYFYTMQFIQGAGLHQVLDEIRRLEHSGVEAPPLSVAGPDEATVIAGATRSLLTDLPMATSGDGRGVAASRDATTVDRLASTVLDVRRRSMRSIARIGLQVAEALAHAHEQGVLHRDIKPSNILLDGHGHAWVTDFGLAKATDDDDLTHEGDVVGTVRYMAPERFRGSCDPRSDIYALGLTLYELLGRRAAFPDSDRQVLMRKVAQVEPPRLESLCADVPRDLATIVHKAIEKNPVDRYRSAAAMASDLRRFLEDRSIEARRAGPAERLVRWARRNPGLAAMAATVALLLLAIALISSTAAWRLRERRIEVEQRLWEANLARARASRRSESEGRRFEALAALRDAAHLGTYSERHGELRDEAIACLALADLHRINERSLPILSRRNHVMTFSPDGTRIAVGAHGGVLKVFDIRTGAPIRTFLRAGPNPSLIRFSPDGRRLAVRYGPEISGSLLVYEVDTGEILRQQEMKIYAGSLEFDSTGRWLAMGLLDGSVRVDDLDDHHEPIVIPGAPEIHNVRFDPTATRLAVARYSDNDSVVVYDLASRQPVARWSLPIGSLCVAWSPDATQLAVGGGYRELFLLNPHDQSAPPRVLRGHKGAVVSVDFSHRGHLLASGSWDGTARLWHPESGEPLVVASTPDQWLVRFRPDDRTLVGGRDGATCWNWEVADGDELRSRFVDQYPDSRTWTVEFFPQSDMFASSGSAGVRIFDLALREQAHLSIPGFATVKVVPSGDALLTGGPWSLHRWPIERHSGTVRVGPPSPFGPFPGREVGRIRIDAQGRRIAAVLDRRPSVAVVFDADGYGNPVVVDDHPGLERIDLSPDGRLLATGTWRGERVKIWNANTGEPIVTLEVDGSADVAFSPNGRTLITGSGREYVCWDVATWQRLWSHPRREASNQPGKIAFSAHGELVAVAWSRALIHLLNASTGRIVATLEAPTRDHLAELGLSRDGAYLFVNDHGGGTRRWDLRRIQAQLETLGIGWSEFEKLDSPTRYSDSTSPSPPSSRPDHVPQSGDREFSF